MDDNKKPLRFALLTPITIQPNEPNSWSITTQYITQVLQKHCGEVFPIGPIFLRGEVLAGKILNKVSLTLLKKRFLYCDSSHISKRYARVAAQRLAGLSADVIIAPDGASEIAFLETDIPIVLIEGGTFALWRNYPPYLNLLKRSSYEANMLQEMALKKASLILNPSEWAARSVIEDYHIEPRKVHVLPYGANIENPPPLEYVQKKKKSDRCRLLFIGTNWQRKGGDIAFEALVKLEEMGIQAELIVCGCVPQSKFSHERMKVIPYLNKNDERQNQEMRNLFMTADFFLLPTRVELFGIVFCEASAFGLPVITTNTGGISGAVKDGENGFMLPLSAGGSEYAEVIAKIYRDDGRYADMVRASRAAFEQRLNWDTWAITFRELIAEMFEGKKDSF
jgi:glycosyltransferase involved in cell wall biosynthesis